MNNYSRIYKFAKLTSKYNKPRIITLDITNKCNLKCKHCLNESGDIEKYDFSKELSDDEYMQIVEDVVLLSPKQCCICGGEPLLRKDLLLKIIKKLSENRIIVNMVSNGVLLDEETAKELKLNGISSVQISIDGLGIEHNLFRCISNGFDKSVQAIKLLNKVGISTAVSFCPNLYNYRNIETYINFIDKLGCYEIRMMPLLALGRAAKNLEQIQLTKYQLHDFVNNINCLVKKYPHLNIKWGDPLEHIIRSIKNVDLPLTTFGVSSSGYYYYSPYIPLYFGNTKNYNIIEAWDKISEFKKDSRFKNIMKECNNLDFFADFEMKFGMQNFEL